MLTLPLPLPTALPVALTPLTTAAAPGDARAPPAPTAFLPPPSPTGRGRTSCWALGKRSRTRRKSCRKVARTTAGHARTERLRELSSAPRWERSVCALCSSTSASVCGRCSPEHLSGSRREDGGQRPCTGLAQRFLETGAIRRQQGQGDRQRTGGKSDEKDSGIKSQTYTCKKGLAPPTPPHPEIAPGLTLHP